MSIIKFVCLVPVCMIIGFFYSCKPEEKGDKISPTLMSSIPADESIGVLVGTEIKLQFTEKINISETSQILLNNVIVNAEVKYRELSLKSTLMPGITYKLLIPGNTIYDDAGNFAEEISINFTTASTPVQENGLYEAEQAILSDGASVANSQSGFSGIGYVSSGNGNLTFYVNIETSGYYSLGIRFSNSNSKKVNDLYVDGVKLSSLTFGATTAWNTLNAGLLKLEKGAHSISFVKGWGWTNYDYILIKHEPNGTGNFIIDPNLVTPNPSSQAVKVFNFLKDNFGTKVLSGAAPAHSTNINEATWIFNQTGKWPAITCFDFLDHTNSNQNWVKYSAPFTLGQEWWNNKGLIALMWHWRDPLTKSGSMYTAETTFDLSRISDTTSSEYKSMIIDIDVISGYLKQFKDANIPVLWRPLHEASGAWFWWGAKGPENCKKLWNLLFNRMTKVHGLNNMIWVWTTDTDESAYSWYPGDDFVDIIGMDIYPGENQHGSQYFSYNKVKSIFAGKKMITLSECGSVPDPGLMKEYGDMWSYFMPWNGDFTESDKHNGSAWWKKIFSYDFVITRDQMPDLK